MSSSVCNEKPCPAVYIRDSWSRSFTSQDRGRDEEAAYEAVVSYREWAAMKPMIFVFVLRFGFLEMLWYGHFSSMPIHPTLTRDLTWGVHKWYKLNLLGTTQ
jgi:hypothetical protein